MSDFSSLNPKVRLLFSCLLVCVYAGRRGCIEKGTRKSAEREEEVETSFLGGMDSDVNDCISCRVAGAAVCFSLSGYLTISAWVRPHSSLLHKRITLLAAGGFAAMGLIRSIT